VIAIILGGMGLLGSLVTMASLAAGSRLQQAMTMPPQGPGGNKLAELQRAMQQKIQAVTDRYRWPNAGFALINVGLAAGMLAGGIMALNRNPRAGKLLITVFAVAILFEISRAILQVFMQWEMAAVMSDWLPRMMGASAPANGPGAQQAAAMGAVLAKVGIIAGLAINLIFSVAKLVYYAVGCSYLRRPAVRQWLENAGGSFSAADGGGT
jgi:hypothetical protein